MQVDVPEQIQAKIRTKIRARRLPLPPKWSVRVWAGTGKGDVCSACDRPITASDLESEIAELSLRFHKACFDLWNLGLGSE
jgi:hypothetical protein